MTGSAFKKLIGAFDENISGVQIGDSNVEAIAKVVYGEAGVIASRNGFLGVAPSVSMICWRTVDMERPSRKSCGKTILLTVPRRHPMPRGRRSMMYSKRMYGDSRMRRSFSFGVLHKLL